MYWEIVKEWGEFKTVEEFNPGSVLDYQPVLDYLSENKHFVLACLIP